MIFERHANLKYKFGNRHFWSEGYYVSTVGLMVVQLNNYNNIVKAHLFWCAFTMSQ
jgi:REP element-mobilizing transposase RayT